LAYKCTFDAVQTSLSVRRCWDYLASILPQGTWLSIAFPFCDAAKVAIIAKQI
jgi:hypothetical protein